MTTNYPTYISHPASKPKDLQLILYLWEDFFTWRRKLSYFFYFFSTDEFALGNREINQKRFSQTRVLFLERNDWWHWTWQTAPDSATATTDLTSVWSPRAVRIERGSAGGSTITFTRHTCGLHSVSAMTPLCRFKQTAFQPPRAQTRRSSNSFAIRRRSKFLWAFPNTSPKPNKLHFSEGDGWKPQLIPVWKKR